RAAPAASRRSSGGRRPASTGRRGGGAGARSSRGYRAPAPTLIARGGAPTLGPDPRMSPGTRLRRLVDAAATLELWPLLPSLGRWTCAGSREFVAFARDLTPPWPEERDDPAIRGTDLSDAMASRLA